MTPDAPRVLVGYDGTPPARAAVRWALARAGDAGSVFVCHAVEPPYDWPALGSFDQVMLVERRAGDALLGALSQELGDGPTMRLLVGEPSSALIECAHGLAASEIVVGSRGRTAPRWELGHVCRSLLRRFDRPIVAVPPEAAMAVGPGYRLRRVLVVADAATDSPAFGFGAAAVAGPTGAAIDVIPVEDGTRATDVVEHVRAGLVEVGIDGEVATLGLSASELDDVRRAIVETGADLVVVGSAMRAGAPQIGPIATSLLARASCPVMVVPSIPGRTVVPFRRL